MSMFITYWCFYLCSWIVSNAAHDCSGGSSLVNNSLYVLISSNYSSGGSWLSDRLSIGVLLQLTNEGSGNCNAFSHFRGSEYFSV